MRLNAVGRRSKTRIPEHHILQNLLRQERAEAIGNRLHTVSLQEMNPLTQLPLIESERHGLRNRRSRPLPGSAQRIVCLGLGVAKALNATGFAANRAKRARLFGKVFPEGIVGWNAGETRKRLTTEAAGCRGESAAETVRRTSQHSSNRSPCRGSGPHHVERMGFTLTAEDAPLTARLPLLRKSIHRKSAQFQVPLRLGRLAPRTNSHRVERTLCALW